MRVALDDADTHFTLGIPLAKSATKYVLVLYLLYLVAHNSLVFGKPSVISDPYAHLTVR